MTTQSLSPKEAIVMELLESSDKSFCYQLVKDSDRRLKLTGVYVMMARLTKKGFVQSELDIEGKRRLYRLTDFGRVALKAHRLVASYQAR
jgi:DNA-binding PadR family transcriptional regulator